MFRLLRRDTPGPEPLNKPQYLSSIWAQPWILTPLRLTTFGPQLLSLSTVEAPDTCILVVWYVYGVQAKTDSSTGRSHDRGDGETTRFDRFEVYPADRWLAAQYIPLSGATSPWRGACN